MENNENRQSLLNKVSEKFKNKYHNFNAKIKKSIKTVANKACPLVLAAAMALTPLAFTACNNNVDPNTPTNPPIVDVNPGSGTQPGIEIPGTENPDINGGQEETEQYSQLLQNVLNNEYYNNLINLAKSDSSYLSSHYFDQHPFAILEEYGVDTAAIKRGELKCVTSSYIKKDKPNNLFLYTYAENAGGYYDDFSFEYELTEQEMKDYKMLHTHIDDNNQGANAFYQLCFINDQISKEKDPVSVTHTKISKQARDYLFKDKQMLSLMKNYSNSFLTNIDFVLKEVNAEENRLTLILLPISNINNSLNFSILEVEMYTPYGNNNVFLVVENGVFKGPYDFDNTLLRVDNQSYTSKEECKHIHLKTPFLADMNDIKTGELEFENQN